MKILLKLLVILAFPLVQHAQEVTLEIYAKVPQAVGNIAYTHEGELVYSHHPLCTKNKSDAL